MSEVQLNVDKASFERLFNVNLKVSIDRLSTPYQPIENSAMFVLKVEDIAGLEKCNELLIFSSDNKELQKLNTSHQIITSVNPRLSFIKFVRFCTDWDKSRLKNGTRKNQTFIDDTASVHPSAKIFPFCYIGPNCQIDPECILETGAKLIADVKLGKKVTIGANSVVGQQGFSIERENNREREAIPFDGLAVSMPHIGGVEIADDCEIGANCTIAGGTIFPTRILTNVRIDDQVFIAHNCYIGEGTAIIAQSEISGSVIIEKNCWIGPGSSITQKVTIGERSLIGIGSNVTSNVEPGSVSAGNPAKKIRDNK